MSLRTFQQGNPYTRRRQCLSGTFQEGTADMHNLPLRSFRLQDCNFQRRRTVGRDTKTPPTDTPTTPSQGDKRLSSNRWRNIPPPPCCRTVCQCILDIGTGYFSSICNSRLGVQTLLHLEARSALSRGGPPRDSAEE